jgi:PAS domain S-box-containing protein
MHQDLFDLDFSRWEILLHSILPALINFGILCYVSFTFKKTKTNTLFSVFIFLLGGWQLTEGLMRLSISEITAITWLRISEIFTIFLVPSLTIFVLRFTKWEQKSPSNLISILFIIPAVVLSIFIQAQYDSFIFIPADTMYWLTNPQTTPFMVLLYSWMSMGAMFTLTLLWIYYFKNRKNILNRKRSRLLIIGITIPVVGAVVGEMILPLLFTFNVIPVAVPVMTIFSVTILIAIKKYKILDFSPKHHWEQIILNEGLLIVNTKDEIMYANQTFCLMTDYESSEIEGQNAASLFLKTEKKTFARSHENPEDLMPLQYEIELITKKGDIKWMLVNCSPYIDSNKKTIGALTVLKDVTVLKMAEQELIANETRLKKAQKVAHLGSWELNFSTNVAVWSEEACVIYGLSPDDNHQSYETWLSFLHPEDIDHVKKEIEKSQLTFSNSIFKHRIICKDGTVKYLSSASEFSFDDKGIPIGLTGICQDITPLMIAQKAAMESEDQMTTFMNESLLCIYAVDPATKKVLYANSAFQQLLNYSTAEMKSLKMYDFVDYSISEVDSKIEELINAGKISNEERQWKRKDGQIIHVLVSRYYVNKNGKETIITAAQDVTERKNAEKALQLTNQELETFIYRASHDLRGPLASIIGLANLSKLEIQDETALKYLNMIGTGTEKLDYTLTELVKAMEIRNIEEFNNEINFETLVKEALIKFEFFPGYSRLKIKTNISIKKMIRSNRFILETILQNLIENSIKYQNHANSESFININIYQNNEIINIVVEDNGLGIDQSIQEKIFEMYFRGVNDLKGSGLGLYLVKKGIEKLKGNIHLSSVKGEGSTFSIKFSPASPIFLN